MITPDILIGKSADILSELDGLPVSEAVAVLAWSLAGIFIHASTAENVGSDDYLEFVSAVTKKAIDEVVANQKHLTH